MASEWQETTLGACHGFSFGRHAIEGSSGLLERLNSLGLRERYESAFLSRTQRTISTDEVPRTAQRSCPPAQCLLLARGMTLLNDNRSVSHGNR